MSGETFNANRSEDKPTRSKWDILLEEPSTKTPSDTFRHQSATDIYLDEQSDEKPLPPIELKNQKIADHSIRSLKEQLTNPDFYEDGPEYIPQKIKNVRQAGHNENSKHDTFKRVASYVGINAASIALAVVAKDVAPVVIAASITYTAVKGKKPHDDNMSIKDMLNHISEGDKEK